MIDKPFLLRAHRGTVFLLVMLDHYEEEVSDLS